MSSLYCASCGAAMELLHCEDTGTGVTMENYSIAYNLHICSECKAICRENVWDFASKVWVFANNVMFKE